MTKQRGRAAGKWEIMVGVADEKKSGGGLSGLVQAESMLQLALAIPGGCFVGLLAGSWLDRHYHQHFWAVLLMLLGSAGGFVQIFTVLAKTGRRGGSDGA